MGFIKENLQSCWHTVNSLCAALERKVRRFKNMKKELWKWKLTFRSSKALSSLRELSLGPFQGLQKKHLS